MATKNLLEILRRLRTDDVEFVVVGGMAGVMRGAPITTVDIDIVHDRSTDNVRRLLEVLLAMNARYRHDPRNLQPTESHLVGPGHQLLQTELGPVDVLGEVSGATYADLLPDSSLLDIGDGFRVHVVKLARLIELKRSAGRPKDFLALPVLQATLDATEETNDEN